MCRFVVPCFGHHVAAHNRARCHKACLHCCCVLFMPCRLLLSLMLLIPSHIRPQTHTHTHTHTRDSGQLAPKLPVCRSPVLLVKLVNRGLFHRQFGQLITVDKSDRQPLAASSGEGSASCTGQLGSTGISGLLLTWIQLIPCSPRLLSIS